MYGRQDDIKTEGMKSIEKVKRAIMQKAKRGKARISHTLDSQYAYGLWFALQQSPDAPPLGVVVEHPVPLLPDDVLGLLAHDVLHHALQLDGGALVVEDPVLHLLVALVHNLDSWH